MTKASPPPPRLPFPYAGMAVSALWLIALVPLVSNATISITAIFLAYAAIVWGIVWLIRFAAWVWLVRRGRRARMPAARAGFYWGIEPGVCLLTLALASAGAFQQARFYLSASALQAYVQDVQSGKVPEQQGGAPERSVGLYTVTETQLLPDGVVRFLTCYDGWTHEAGFAYSPAGKPPRLGKDDYTRIDGPWWKWARDDF